MTASCSLGKQSLMHSSFYFYFLFFLLFFFSFLFLYLFYLVKLLFLVLASFFLLVRIESCCFSITKLQHDMQERVHYAAAELSLRQAVTVHPQRTCKRAKQERKSANVLFADNNCFQSQLMIAINHIVLVFYLGRGQVLRGKDQEVLFLICFSFLKLKSLSFTAIIIIIII